jgi:hypothetical protein
MIDPRIKQVTTTGNNNRGLPQFFIENIWGEKFRIEYVDLPGNQLAAHAVKIKKSAAYRWSILTSSLTLIVNRCNIPKEFLLFMFVLLYIPCQLKPYLTYNEFLSFWS